ncbi:MAG: US12 family protein [Flavobacteriales bacterium]|nr:US12 family protein [Flavobacteriales bacterium]
MNLNNDGARTPNMVIDITDAERAIFYRKTYAHVAGALLAFILVESVFLNIPSLVEFMLSLTQGYLWLVLLGAFWLASSIANNFAHALDRTKQYIGLGLYVIIEALIFVPLLYIAMYYSGGFEMIKQAGIVTLFLFAGLTAVVFMTNTNFSFLKTALTIGFFIALGLIVAGILFGFELGLWFSVLMVVFAGGCILYQTSQIKYEYHEDQYVGAALGLFASFMLLFWYILQLFMSRD